MAMSGRSYVAGSGGVRDPNFERPAAGRIRP
jgi:hypothetical protein